MAETYYEILDVQPDATKGEITAAYRDRVLETHPDRNDDPDAAAQFTAVTRAEEVLSDETERARYDRLGHASYVRLMESPTVGPQTESRSEPQTDDGRSRAGSSAGTSSRSRSRSQSRTRSRSGSRSAAHSSAGERERGDRRTGPSHHARHRDRRQRSTANAHRRRGTSRATARSRTASSADSRTTDYRHSTRGGDGYSGGGGSGERAQTGTRSRTATTEAGDESSFRYAVHDWDDEVDVGDPSGPPDQQTLVTAACVSVVYPILVYSSLTPQFPIVVNVFLAACTLVLAGYLLTLPTLAIGAFGFWSVLVPFALSRFDGVDPLSLLGLLAVGFVWLPFGYAVAVRWALRP